MEHTKGPWIVEDYAQESQQIICAPSDHNAVVAICRNYGSAEFPVAVTFTETRKANALLIAGAPKMLETLKAIALFPCNCPADKIPGDACESCIARDAIAEIEGR